MTVAFGRPEVVEENVDLLIIGGGSAGCGAAYELKPWIEAARAEGIELTVKLVDKAAIARSGAAGQGLSHVGTYLGERDPADFTRATSRSLMGITRDDLVYDLGRHVDDSVHLLEEWGLPIWKRSGDAKPLGAGGQPMRYGDWGIMVSGESYKPMLAESAVDALGAECIDEHVCIVKLLTDGDERRRIAGAVGFSLREHKMIVYRCRACLLAAGGAARIFGAPPGDAGSGAPWAPPAGAGSTVAMAAEAGAELTMMESRSAPIRFKGGGAPAGVWFRFFGAKPVNADGVPYAQMQIATLDEFGAYAQAKEPAHCLRSHLLLAELQAGRGPIYLDTVDALGARTASMTPKDIKQLEARAWQGLLDADAAQAVAWAAGNLEPEKKNPELMLAEPELTGSALGCAGLWVSGPDDLGAPTDEEHPEDDRIPPHLPRGWHWGYRGMTTVQGLFSAGAGVGASGHKFACGAHAEGRIAAKAMVSFCLDHAGPDRDADAGSDSGTGPLPELDTTGLVEEVYRPVRNHLRHSGETTDLDTDPNTITPNMLQRRLEMVMDEYAGGVSTLFRTNAHMLAVAEQGLELLKEDALKLRATDAYELLRAWEATHRLLAAEAHVKHLRFREETRYPGFCYRQDHAELDEEHWHCFVNSVYDAQSKTWTCFKRAHVDLVDKAKTSVSGANASE
jgi:adenylylsulfate reductase subunit A